MTDRNKNGIDSENKAKKTFYTELSYVLGIYMISLGTAFAEAANLGLSMVVAPAYLLHLKISETYSFFSFGMAEYTFQACLLIVMIIVLRRFRPYYLFSFITAVIYGMMLDGNIILVGLLPCGTLPLRVLFFALGLLISACGVSFIFHTYISPAVYELCVKEVSTGFNLNINKFKMAYDCTSCVVGVIMSFAFFGMWHFRGISVGTVICALLNGWLISRFSYFFEKRFEFKDGLRLRKYFE